MAVAGGYGCDCWTAVQREDSPRESTRHAGELANMSRYRICRSI